MSSTEATTADEPVTAAARTTEASTETPTATTPTSESLQEKAQAALAIVAVKAEEASTVARKFMGLVAEPETNGGEGYTPSRLSTKMFVSKTTNYEKNEYENKYSGGNLKILVLATEQRYLECANGLKFSTGNHPTETFLPLLHLDKAGFGIDIATPTGQTVKTETWAMPHEDANVLFIQQKLKPKLDKPLSIKDVASKLGSDSPYVAVFIPGGHGAMLGLPEDENVGKVIDWAMDNDKFIVTLCHGPAALLAASNKKFDGYSLVCFPNALDKLCALIGYLPGSLNWYMGDKLVEEQGMKVVNVMATGGTHVDRKLLTGDSPNAANALGKLAAEMILASVNPKKGEDDDI
ncbi:hypothetical protein MPSEU_000931300 [Mayamaea pseudoterrestris]|nr:hypothetical protein MPSEU_000931300 [Mayamaea pseudoterrestris]